ncbi:MAG: DUF4058 family protein [Planctomycetota bacterium]|nr:DUF4058 family protein [Planctomycetota bacterium]MDA1138720.1 DUF4058 family protein [Planctomycetota bacterium]
MKSPFPGMDPYLERYWRDVHQGLITYSRDALQPNLPADLRARIEERVFVETDSEKHDYYPDVYNVEQEQTLSAPDSSGTVAVATPPKIIRITSEPVSEAYIEILDAASGNKVVTVIEFLSPSNKIAGEGRDAYLRKQREVRAGGANLVEIDLVRKGEWTFSLERGYMPLEDRSASYMVVARRGSKRFEAETYPIWLKDRLPNIRIPLRQEDEDVILDLQMLLEKCYQNGRYDLDYSEDLDNGLPEEEQEWLIEFLRSENLR